MVEACKREWVLVGRDGRDALRSCSLRALVGLQAPHTNMNKAHPLARRHFMYNAALMAPGALLAAGGDVSGHTAGMTPLTAELGAAAAGRSASPAHHLHTRYGDPICLSRAASCRHARALCSRWLRA